MNHVPTDLILKLKCDDSVLLFEALSAGSK